VQVVKSNVTVFLSDQLLGRVRAEAEADGRSMSNFIEKILREHYHPGSTQRSSSQVDIEDQIASTKPQRKSPAKRK
jgi:hypothetical protein